MEKPLAKLENDAPRCDDSSNKISICAFQTYGAISPAYRSRVDAMIETRGWRSWHAVYHTDTQPWTYKLGPVFASSVGEIHGGGSQTWDGAPLSPDVVGEDGRIRTGCSRGLAKSPSDAMPRIQHGALSREHLVTMS